jgi:hypothetical protein
VQGPRARVNLVANQGHEDVDQAFGQTAGYISQSTFDDINGLVDLLDSATRPNPEKSAHGKTFRNARAERLDQTADWKLWVSRLGIKMSGLRNLVIFQLTSPIPQRTQDPTRKRFYTA